MSPGLEKTAQVNRQQYLEDNMANVNTAPTPVVLITEDQCIPNNVVRDSAGNPVKDTNGAWKIVGEEILDAGPQAARTQGLSVAQRIPKSYLVSNVNPDPPGGIGRLNVLYTKALMTVLGKAASGSVYSVLGPTGQVGKYQMTAGQLVLLGYVKSEHFVANGADCLKSDAAWTGKDRIVNLQSWFISSGIQENAMYQMLLNNYTVLSGNQGIKSDDNLCTLAGMLAVAHIIGPDAGTEQFPGAVRWRYTGGGQDQNGNTGNLYFGLGRYAVDVLAAKV